VANNLEVLVQAPNKPGKRHVVGYLTDGTRPTADDWTRWGIPREKVLDARVRKIGGERKYLVVARDIPDTKSDVQSS